MFGDLVFSQHIEHLEIRTNQVSNRDIDLARCIHGLIREDDPISHPAISECEHETRGGQQQFVHVELCN